MVKIRDLEVSPVAPMETDQVAVVDDRGVMRRWHTVGEWEQMIRADECAKVIQQVACAEERSIDLNWRLLLNYYGLPRRGK